MSMLSDNGPARSRTDKKGGAVPALYCDLEVAGWAVISSRGVEVTMVTFRQACRAVIRLENVSGATITTADAAARFAASRKQEAK